MVRFLHCPLNTAVVRHGRGKRLENACPVKRVQGSIPCAAARWNLVECVVSSRLVANQFRDLGPVRVRFPWVPLMLRTKTYVDVEDFPDAAKEAYKDFTQECGVDNGEGWPWCVGEEDSVPASYIGQDKCSIIDDALRDFGAKDGQDIELIFTW